jgi:hypothetical protein
MTCGGSRHQLSQANNFGKVVLEVGILSIQV